MYTMRGGAVKRSAVHHRAGRLRIDDILFVIMALQENSPIDSAPNSNLLGVPAPEAIVPSRGVVTLFGYGIRVAVERGHLVIEDGIGLNRRAGRLPRVGHGLKRLIIIGADGGISLAALRWLADQDAAFVMLDREGSVLVTTGPVRASDAKLRRAQALAHESGVALQISRELIFHKIKAQEKLVRESLSNPKAADAIARMCDAIPSARTIEAVRLLESRAAYSYWGTWSDLPINFPTCDLRRVPDHWRTFINRASPLTGSPRLAANPINAILNYLYALLESETRLAVAALGLDPGLGFLHMDAPSRDSLACDVMEPIRPMVDAYVMDWIRRERLKREWFFEQRDGSCRLMGPFAVRLSQTAPSWASVVAPIAEMVARELWRTTGKNFRNSFPPTNLTQSNRRESKSNSMVPATVPLPTAESFCQNCGRRVGRGSTRCAACNNALRSAGLIEAARKGRIAAQTDQAQQRRIETQLRHEVAKTAWNRADLPTWPDKTTYLRDIQPKLETVTLSKLASRLGVSIPYAVDIRKGRKVPHERHWQNLAELVALSGP
jgi:CRISPR-associated endonuclease Cas1